MFDTPMTDGSSPAAPTRRGFLKGVGGVLAIGAIAPLRPVAMMPKSFRIALSDRAVGLRQNLGIFAIAGGAGIAGVELDMGRLGRRPQLVNRLADAGERQKFADHAQAAGVEIASLALTAFAEQSFASHPQALVVAAAWLDALRDCGVRTGVLPFGPACDLDHPADRPAAIERLKRVADRAEREGRTIALHAPVSAESLAGVLDAVRSPAVAACVTTGPSLAGDIQMIGPRRIAQIRDRNDASAGLAAALRSLPADWNGWLVIERTADGEAGIADQCADAQSRLAASAIG